MVHAFEFCAVGASAAGRGTVKSDVLDTLWLVARTCASRSCNSMSMGGTLESATIVFISLHINVG